MTLGSVFSGIGGMDLGFKRAGFDVRWQIEIDPFCRAVLAKHWPNVRRYEDVRTVDAEQLERVDCIVGGFPCQDVSNAGRRAGLSGERSGLYRELLRCIRVVRPLYAVLENVAALLHRGMGEVLGDLAEIGYGAEWDCLPACAVGALHHRDRVFVTAICADAGGVRLQRLRPSAAESWSWEQFEGLVQAELRMAVPAGKAGGISDGVSQRVHRLKGLGNAVVPQVAEIVARSIISS